MTDAPTANEIPVEGTHDIARYRRADKTFPAPPEQENGK